MYVSSYLRVSDNVEFFLVFFFFFTITLVQTVQPSNTGNLILH